MKRGLCSMWEVQLRGLDCDHMDSHSQIRKPYPLQVDRVSSSKHGPFASAENMVIPSVQIACNKSHLTSWCGFALLFMQTCLNIDCFLWKQFRHVFNGITYNINLTLIAVVTWYWLQFFFLHGSWCKCLQTKSVHLPEYRHNRPRIPSLLWKM